MASDIMERGEKSTSGGTHDNVEPQATDAAANNTSTSWKQVRKSSWEAGRGDGVGTGRGSGDLDGYEGEPLLREEVKYYHRLECPKQSSGGWITN